MGVRRPVQIALVLLLVGSRALWRQLLMHLMGLLGMGRRSLLLRMQRAKSLLLRRHVVT